MSSDAWRTGKCVKTVSGRLNICQDALFLDRKGRVDMPDWLKQESQVHRRLGWLPETLSHLKRVLRSGADAMSRLIEKVRRISMAI